jgi:ADP-heptose:LPS heptosyltransferase
MKLIDNLMGKPLCQILTLYYAFFKKNKSGERMVETINPEKILLIKFFGIGSIIYISPSIRLLKSKYPDAKVSFLTFEEHRDLCEMIDEVDTIIPFKVKGLIHLIIEVPLLILKLRRERFDMVYNFEFHARFPTIISYLCGARGVTEFHSDFFYKGNLPSKRVAYALEQHVTDSFKSMVSDNHTLIDQTSLYLNIPEYDEKFIGSFLTRQGIYTEKTSGSKAFLIAVNINTSGMAHERRWNVKKFARLIELLIDNFDMYIFLTGGKGDCEYVNSLKEMFRNNERVINMAGKLSLKGLAALYKRCDMVISNDSGPLHVAEAVGAKTVSLFGPETPRHYGPRGENHTVIYKGLPCSPCLSPLNMKSANCKIGIQCMELITVDEVFYAVKDILKPQMDNREQRLMKGVHKF